MSRRSLVAWAASIHVLALVGAPSPCRSQQDAEDPAAAVKPHEKADAADPARGLRAKIDAIRAELTDETRYYFHCLYLAELRFIRSASGAGEDQLRRIARSAQGPLKMTVALRVAKQLAINLVEMSGQDFDPNGVIYEANDLSADQHAVEQALTTIARAQLAPDQWARYRDQAEKRARHRKQTAIRSIVVALEIELRLTAEQRDRIGESMTAHWDPSWEFAGLASDEEGHCFPEIPDPLIVPFLTPGQKAAWERQPKAIVAELAEDLVSSIGLEGDPLAADLDPDRQPAAAAPK